MQQNADKQGTGSSSRAPLRQHGVLIQVFDTGILLIGESGIGKSECALDLITRGHRLVADDAVDISADSTHLTGTAPLATKDLLEIRGLGVIDVRTAFGDDAVAISSRVDICIELRKEPDVEGVGNFIHEHEIGGTNVPKFILPVTPGRNLAIIAETAVRLFQNRSRGAAAGDALLAMLPAGRDQYESV